MEGIDGTITETIHGASNSLQLDLFHITGISRGKIIYSSVQK